jgi:3-methylcrotonyl-CoA carboxylase beta subunit
MPNFPPRASHKSPPLWALVWQGGAYLPIMSDEALIVEKTGSVFLAGPYLVKAAIGEDADKETLGGAATHSEISGVTDYKMPDDPTCLDTIKDLVDKFGRFEHAGFRPRRSANPQPANRRCF